MAILPKGVHTAEPKASKKDNKAKQRAQRRASKRGESPEKNATPTKKSPKSAKGTKTAETCGRWLMAPARAARPPGSSTYSSRPDSPTLAVIMKATGLAGAPSVCGFIKRNPWEKDESERDLDQGRDWRPHVLRIGFLERAKIVNLSPPGSPSAVSLSARRRINATSLGRIRGRHKAKSLILRVLRKSGFSCSVSG